MIQDSLEKIAKRPADLDATQANDSKAAQDAKPANDAQDVKPVQSALAL